MSFKYEDHGTVYVVPYLTRRTTFVEHNSLHYNTKEIFVKSPGLMKKIIRSLEIDFWKIIKETEDYIEFKQADHILIIKKAYGENWSRGAYEEWLLKKRGLKPYQYKMIVPEKQDELLKQYMEHRRNGHEARFGN